MHSVSSESLSHAIRLPVHPAADSTNMVKAELDKVRLALKESSAAHAAVVLLQPDTGWEANAADSALDQCSVAQLSQLRCVLGLVGLWYRVQLHLLVDRERPRH